MGTGDFSMIQSESALNRIRPRTFAVIWAVTLTLSAAPALALDWHLDPSITVGGLYDDNYRLDFDRTKRVSVKGAEIDAAAKFRAEGPLFRVELTPRLRSTFYPGNTEEQANDQFFDLNLQRRWERMRFSMTGDYWRQIVLRNYLPTTDITNGLGNSVGNPDIAPITTRNRQEFARLAPTVSFDLSPIQRLIVDTEVIDVRYAEQTAGLRQNFKNYHASLGFGMDFSPRSTGTFSVVSGLFRPDAGSNANTYGFQGQWTFNQSTVSQYYARVGADRTSFSGGSASANSFSGGVGASRKFQTTDLFIDLTRSMTPNSGGTVVAQNELRVRLEHRFSARTAGFVAVRGIKNSAIGQTTTFSNDQFVTGSVGVEYRLYRQFSMTGQYIYTNKKNDTVANAANSNSITLTLVYQPHRPAEDLPILND